MDLLLALSSGLLLLLVLLNSEILKEPYHKSREGGRTYGSQSPSNSPRLFRSQIEREVILLLIELPKVLSGLLVGHGQHPSDRFASSIAIKSFVRWSAFTHFIHMRDEHLG